MDTMKNKWKKNLFLKAWDGCRSLSFGSNKKSSSDDRPSLLQKSKSWSSTTTTSTKFLNLPSHDHQEKNVNDTSNSTKRIKKRRQVAPKGCFSVYVGPEKQKFVVKIKFANHPLFRMLLEDAEMEYGFTSQGPILLPCEVDMFYKVLAEMDNSEDDIISNSHRSTKFEPTLPLQPFSNVNQLPWLLQRTRCL